MLRVDTFTAGADGLPEIHIVIESSQDPDSASLTYPDGKISDILKYIEPDKKKVGWYHATVPDPNGHTNDGVLTLDISNPTENLRVSIANFVLGTQFLLSKTINKEYDCVLLQNLEACRQLIMASQSDLARDIYKDVQNQAASCTDAAMLGYHVEKTNISIQGGTYILC